MIFMTKQGLQQLEEVIESRNLNTYRNKHVPVQSEIPSQQYLGVYNPKSRQTPEWTNIIKPIISRDDVPETLDVLTPSLSKLHFDLQRKEIEQATQS